MAGPAFWDDVDAAGLTDRVLLMTSSEFGRTVFENGSGGLDHGTASVGLVMGPVEPGRLGTYPSLVDLDGNRDLIASLGLDSYLGGVVERWFGVTASEIFETRPEPLGLLFG